MIRHEYTACGMCHADPSGAGILTSYGRAQGEILLRTQYSNTESEEDPAKLGGFAFGLVTLPEWLQVQGDLRGMFLHVAPPDPAPSVNRTILMQADVATSVNVDHLRAAISLGYAHEGALGASLTHGEQDRLVSRQHWAGVAFGADDAFLLRAGRMNLPFGLRIIEHTSFVRSSTFTDINAAQQHGVALAWNKEGWRAEAMAIAGNFQLHPDTLRERGASAYVERALSSSAAIGATSLVTHTVVDLETRTATFRQAHGVFGRFVPAKPVVVMAEIDALVRSPKREPIDIGATGFLQVDVEPFQGIHLAATGEMLTNRYSVDPLSLGGWLTAAWFFAPHADIRLDLVERKQDDLTVTTLLAQLHGRL